ncbi:hypothetical protein VE00_00238 [Pseudogymnoascus sp. WSF 3629]|nr:hypothetical protein VE00_00238 [Pseudogymnoascus sp. WSF 3629]
MKFVTAATTPQQVVEGFRLLTQKAQALVPVAESINIINTPLITIGQGPFPIIISGFSDQIKIGDALIELLKDDFTGLTQADENLVFDAYEEFARAEKSTLNILISKADVLTNVPFIGPPVAAVLHSVEDVVNSISTTLIQKIVSRADDFQSEANSLGNVLDSTIKKYGGLSQ